MTIDVYAIRDERAEKDGPYIMVYLGYPVRYTLVPTSGAAKITLDISDHAKAWMEDGYVMIDEGNGTGTLITFDIKVTLRINTYYGPVDKTLRVMGIERPV